MQFWWLDRPQDPLHGQNQQCYSLTSFREDTSRIAKLDVALLSSLRLTSAIINPAMEAEFQGFSFTPPQRSCSVS